LEGKETEFVAYPLPPVRLLVAYNPAGGFSFAKRAEVRNLKHSAADGFFHELCLASGIFATCSNRIRDITTKLARTCH
jgi:hypothetical protein